MRPTFPTGWGISPRRWCSHEGALDRVHRRGRVRRAARPRCPGRGGLRVRARVSARLAAGSMPSRARALIGRTPLCSSARRVSPSARSRRTCAPRRAIRRWLLSTRRGRGASRSSRGTWAGPTRWRFDWRAVWARNPWSPPRPISAGCGRRIPGRLRGGSACSSRNASARSRPAFWRGRGRPCLRDGAVEGAVPAGVSLTEERARAQVVVSPRALPQDGELACEPALHIVPRCVYVGVGCRRGASRAAIARAVECARELAGVPSRALAGAASIDLKADEEGLLSWARSAGLAIEFFAAERLARAEGSFSSSPFCRVGHRRRLRVRARGGLRFRLGSAHLPQAGARRGDGGAGRQRVYLHVQQRCGEPPRIGA